MRDISLTIPSSLINRLHRWLRSLPIIKVMILIGMGLAISATAYAWNKDIIVAYGDAESHLNIAKRVISGLTPGLAQLGGVWLPLPHLLMVPFVFFDPLWRSGLAGSIVSGISYVAAAVFIYKLTLLLTKDKWASFFAFIVFVLNPNVLYMQTTPMTELLLIATMTISVYFFIHFLETEKMLSLVTAAFFGLLASLSRYDGWFLVLFEGLVLLSKAIPYKSFVKNIKDRGLTVFSFVTEKGEGLLVLFSTLAVVGILGWFLWGYLILGNPLYFINSQYSAKSQQQGFMARGELITYKNLPLSFIYYFVTAMSNSGILTFGMAIVGLVLLLRIRLIKNRFSVAGLLLTVFIFYVVTLYLGQSIIFIPHLTPTNFEWHLFNARYGLGMVPTVAILVGYLFFRSKIGGRVLIASLFLINLGLFGIGYSPVITLADGTVGLSMSKRSHAETWIHDNYDGGLVLVDDYARTTSVIRTGILMQNIVYIGNGLYWQEGLAAPERKIRWVVMQRDDTVWKNFMGDQVKLDRLYKYFTKVYTSNDILIFKHQ